MDLARRGRAHGLAFALGLVIGLGVATVAANVGWDLTPVSLQDRADALMRDVSVRPTVDEVTLFAAGAYADFGLERGMERVTVRIVRRLDVTIEITASQDVAFGSVPRVCLVGPDPAPDDAGLEDPCWGQPELSDFLASRLLIDEFGHPLLRSSEPVLFKATLWRSDARCDYPTGEWTARLWGDVVIDGVHAGVASAPNVPFAVDVPSPEEPLRIVDPDDTRYCGLATRVYLEQGEPALASPTP